VSSAPGTVGPGIIDTWVNLLRPVAEDQRREGESIFERYGQLETLREGTKPEALLEEMDAAGVEVAGLCGQDEKWVAEVAAQHPKRFFGIASPDPRDIMRCVRTIERCVREYGFKAVKIEPFLWGKPPTDRIYYPIYAKCVELDVTFTTQIGHTGPLYPSEVGRPIYLDQVALDFPDLRIVGGHIGWPWTEEAIAVAWKHRNVYIDTSAHIPKHFPEPFKNFMRTFGKTKCMFASDWPLLPVGRPLDQLDEYCPLPEEPRRNFLRDNAVRAFRLDL
jgi:predicted TIM-barrel fold metal-dependent hydrolase